MPDGHAYWAWRDRLLMHPDGRALGGEPCVKCGAPVPPNAHWKNRDRHVCGPRCNSNLSRQFNRSMRSGAVSDLHGREIAGPEPLANPRTSGPRWFRTLSSGKPPFEWEGFGVVPGDMVERHGIVVSYALMHRDSEDAWIDYWPDHVMVAMELSTQHQTIWSADDDGNLGSTCWAYAGPDTASIYDATFKVAGVDCKWFRERVSACTPEGREYAWEAVVAAPVDAGYEPGWWTPERTELSERRKRISASSGRHARRVRELAATVERFDHLEVYERDGWVCGLCQQPVDSDLSWPDPLSPSLDHIVPLAAGGDHSRANTQLAHWLCNVRKGARYPEAELLSDKV